MATDSSTGTREQDGASRRGRGLGYATRVQVSAHQFMARRASLGMTRRRVRMESEPGRREWMSMLAGISLGPQVPSPRGNEAQIRHLPREVG
ncbi:type VII secretion protein EccB [Mycolicibacterium tusciae]|uniref:type VII secretion protein EccB n=1 Tax=Mycolicibacterium tusciae TaxID=75922 RepID=UPI0011E51476|nr:type VII secretion protein EccB [Mycolicibacterium tusciae]